MGSARRSAWRSGLRLKKSEARVFVEFSDGELQEGVDLGGHDGGRQVSASTISSR